MANISTFKLKDPQTFRIFMSSPFNGLQQERESLTKFYWPRLESKLATRGINLRLVDLKWGITQASAVDSQTINICLREADRSDFFVGLYAQRYGWFGADDTQLQDNFDKAKDRFPWLEGHRDKSVTELEYLHAHLNRPGEIPACFCFRDKTYDDRMVSEAKAEGDKRKERFHTVEGTEAAEKLQSLKNRVISSEVHTLGVFNDYSKPEDAVKFIYDTVSKFVDKELLSSMSEPLSKREKSLQAHETYMKTRSGNYTGGQSYLNELNKYITEDGISQPLTVIGEAGCGKSALIAHWIGSVAAKNDDMILFYHLVGAEPESASPLNLIIRLIENIKLLLTGEEFDTTSCELEEKELLPKLNELFDILGSEEKKMKYKLLIVLDKVDQMKTGRTSKPLYWLPKILPENLRVVVTLTHGSEGSAELLEILEDDYKTQQVKVSLLANDEKLTLCNALLDQNSKSFEQQQLNLILSSPKTNKPFFLTIVINELCVSGSFRALDTQIAQLLEADGVAGVLSNVIKRLEKDYKSSLPDGNLVQQVLCAISLSREGIAESELPMPQHIWTPLIYALEKYLINRAGLLSFSFSEMSVAVESMYLDTNDKVKNSALQVADIFLTEYENCIRNKLPLKKRTILELSHLLKTAGDKATLIKIMSNIEVFEILRKTYSFDLYEYWHFIDVPADVISRRLLKNLDCLAAEKYSRLLTSYEENGLERLIRWKSDVIDDIRMWVEITKLYNGLDLVFDRKILIDSRRPGLTDIQRKHVLVQIRYAQANFFADTGRYSKAIASHMQVLEDREFLIEKEIMAREEIGMSYHGIGVCYYNMKNYDKAEVWYKKALQVQNKDTVENMRANAATFCCLGSIEMLKNKFDEAILFFSKSNELWEKVLPDKVCLDMAYNYHNIALVLRRKDDYEGAEKMYLRSLKLKEKLLGPVSYDVAFTYMNLGVVHACLENQEKSLGDYEKSLEIFKKLAPEGSFHTTMAEENVVNQLTLLDRYEEAEPMFQNVLAFLKTMEGGTANGLAPLHRRFIRWYDDKGLKEKALDVSNCLLQSSKREASDIAYHISLYGSTAESTRGECVKEGTFEFGMEEYPNNQHIIVVKTAVEYERDKDTALSFIKTFCEDTSAPGYETRYPLVADFFVNGVKDFDFAMSVANYGIQFNPDDSKLQDIFNNLEKSKLNTNLENKEDVKNSNSVEGADH